VSDETREWHVSIFDRIACAFVRAAAKPYDLRFGLTGTPAPQARRIAARRIYVR
jgi:hypothetical protein